MLVALSAANPAAPPLKSLAGQWDMRTRIPAHQAYSLSQVFAIHLSIFALMCGYAEAVPNLGSKLGKLSVSAYMHAYACTAWIAQICYGMYKVCLYVSHVACMHTHVDNIICMYTRACAHVYKIYMNIHILHANTHAPTTRLHRDHEPTHALKILYTSHVRASYLNFDILLQTADDKTTSVDLPHMYAANSCGVQRCIFLLYNISLSVCTWCFQGVGMLPFHFLYASASR